MCCPKTCVAACTWCLSTCCLHLPTLRSVLFLILQFVLASSILKSPCSILSMYLTLPLSLPPFIFPINLLDFTVLLNFFRDRKVMEVKGLGKVKAWPSFPKQCNFSLQPKSRIRLRNLVFVNRSVPIPSRSRRHQMQLESWLMGLTRHRVCADFICPNSPRLSQDVKPSWYYIFSFVTLSRDLYCIRPVKIYCWFSTYFFSLKY